MAQLRTKPQTYAEVESQWKQDTQQKTTKKRKPKKMPDGPWLPFSKKPFKNAASFAILHPIACKIFMLMSYKNDFENASNEFSINYLHKACNIARNSGLKYCRQLVGQGLIRELARAECTGRRSGPDGGCHCIACRQPRRFALVFV